MLLAFVRKPFIYKTRDDIIQKATQHRNETGVYIGYNLNEKNPDGIQGIGIRGNSDLLAVFRGTNQALYLVNSKKYNPNVADAKNAVLGWKNSLTPALRNQYNFIV